MQKSQVQFLGQEDPLEKGMPTHSSTVAWESHAQMDTGGYSPWSHSQMWLSNWHFHSHQIV